MTKFDRDGRKISYESDELIAELEKDIEEFGKNIEMYAIFKWINGAKIYTDYDFIEEDLPLSKDELDMDEFVEIMSAEKLMNHFKEQNDIFKEGINLSLVI